MAGNGFVNETMNLTVRRSRRDNKKLSDVIGCVLNLPCEE